MENFKEALIQFSHSNPSLFPNDSDNSYPMLIEQCFHQFFADFQTPDHPTYAAMIYRAIWELNKKRGSSEKSISKFIKKEYANLPWAHSTLLKHHLDKLCNRNEILLTHKQCYLLVGADSEPDKKRSGPVKKLKKQKIRLGLEAGKKTSRSHKKYKKKKKCLLDDEGNRVKRKEKLKFERKSSKRVKKHAIKESLKQSNDESSEQKQMVEVNMDDIEIQEQNEVGQIGLRKRKRTHMLKFRKKSNKRVKKYAINEANDTNLKHDNDESHEQKQMVVVNMDEIQIQELNDAGQESDRDNYGHVNFEQILTNTNPEVLRLEESPDSKLISHVNGKRIWTRSQLKIISQKNESDNSAIVENLSNEEQQMSRSPSLEKPLVELLKSISSKLTRLPNDEPTTGQRSTEKSTIEDNTKYKRRGRHPKRMKRETDEVLCNSKSAGIIRKSQKSVKKGKVVNKKVQPKKKRDVGHKMSRRSSRKPNLLG